MKYLSIIYLVFLVITFQSCSNSDDDGGDNGPHQEEETISLRATTITYKHGNGTAISNNECLNPEEDYLIEISVQRVGTNEIKPTQIQYTINGALYSMTFTNVGTQTNPVTVVEGVNLAQLVDTGLQDEIHFIFQGDFDLVQ